MRYEVMQLAQFLVSLSLVLGAFLVGVYAGWRRWGRPPLHEYDLVVADTPLDLDGRRDLFAPDERVVRSASEIELDLRAPDGTLQLCLPAPSPQSSPLRTPLT